MSSDTDTLPKELFDPAALEKELARGNAISYCKELLANAKTYLNTQFTMASTSAS